ncbi:MAG TPA: pyridoxamine 5'-phosphate oxidase family protein [Baekduia sp.]|nr:pyridoxamine 5'-phosphate oxidase family protein [Baekduia sp.]
MARWSEVEREAPELVARARGFLDAFTHKTIATIRRDGSPRISGTELQLADGDAWIGSMWAARKARDLQRDPRYALHSGSTSPPGWNGDAKIAGRAVEVTDPAILDAHRTSESGEEVSGPYHLFRLEIAELVVVGLNDARDALVVESWHEGRGVTRVER